MNDNRYLVHREVIIVILGLALLGFGIYTNSYSQIYPAKDRPDTGGFESYSPTDTRKPIVDNKAYPAAPNNTATAAYDPAKVSPVVIDGNRYFPVDPASTVTNGTYNGNWTYYNPNQNQWRWVPSQSGTGGGYWQTNSGTYVVPGFYEPVNMPQQGGNISGSYNNQSGTYIVPGSYEPVYVPPPTNNVLGNNGSSSQIFTVPGSTDQLVPATLSSATSENVNFKNCAAFTKYHSFGDKGGDIMTIQMFLKEKGYYRGSISGVYGITTFKAVQAFQKDYSDQILNPWGIGTKEATGVWYKSTRKKANQIIGCPEPAVYLERVNKLLEY